MEAPGYDGPQLRYQWEPRRNGSKSSDEAVGQDGHGRAPHDTARETIFSEFGGGVDDGDDPKYPVVGGQ